MAVDLLLYDTTSSYFEMEDDDTERADWEERWEALLTYYVVPTAGGPISGSLSVSAGPPRVRRVHGRYAP